MLAKNVNDNACILGARVACEFFASKLAPTSGLFYADFNLKQGQLWELACLRWRFCSQPISD
ncbi:hypothetical protein C7A10_12685 [Pseudomonas fluorescens]|uniref:Uncharacterized protein n=1 Tax=Pseudomonas fluorescens TaxID=294 RepID=A0A2T0IBQ2_PSEFL|nr:hypothetical protein C7A10_12685 [Pseudomonas fluorescens]